MNHRNESDRRCLERLRQAIDEWVRDGEATRLERWLQRELDDAGAPRRLGLAHWPEGLADLAKARRERGGWSSGVDERVRTWLRGLLRFSRPDGTLATRFHDDEGRVKNRLTLAELAQAYPKTGEARVIAWMLSRPETHHVAPPLPACSSSGRPLAVLRATWGRQGDSFFLDHRQAVPETGFELIGRGYSWLGPVWRLECPPGKASPPRPVLWHSNSVADLAEWSFRTIGLRVTRTAVLFRGRALALLSDQVEGKTLPTDPVEARWTLAPGIASELIEDCRGLLLRGPRKGPNAQVLPITLPALPYETDKGRFHAIGDEAGQSLSLRLVSRGRRCWLPLLVSWDPERHRKRLSWRVLTVVEKSKICPPDVAVAVRVSWGRSETYVIYRSLARPALRSFLGFQTKARLVFGEFDEEGIVKPLVSVD
jgi:hypothetical protein